MRRAPRLEVQWTRLSQEVNMNNREWLLAQLQGMPVIDTHEHLEPEARRIRVRRDIIGLYMTHYASTDVILAGMPAGQMTMLQGDTLSLEEKWRMLRPYWELCRNTAYFRALQRASADLYGISIVDDETIGPLNQAFLAANQPGLYQRILKDKCGIEYAVVDALFEENPGRIEPPDQRFFREAAKYDHFMEMDDACELDLLGHAYGTSFYTFSDYVTLLGHTMQAASRERGIVAVKTAAAYERSLDFGVPSRFDAEQVFDRMLRGDRLDAATRKPLQDYLMHHVISLAEDLGLPVQIHTGLQEGVGGYLPDSRPAHLIPLFQQHPGARFDVFHFSYPYGFELAAIAKQFPNVWVDMCWTHVISQNHAVHALEELLEILPSNKILGYGGDYIFVEGTYAHLQFARENIAQALANRIDRSRLNRVDALTIAGRLLHDNAAALFGAPPEWEVPIG